MIGVIGPPDSTELALSVAAEEGLAASVIGRAYANVTEAPVLAAEFDRVCQVILFTGRVPYALGLGVEGLRATLQFVPHSGADLYRTLVQLLREFQGVLPRVSLDTIESAVVREAYEDLGLDPPRHLLPLEAEPGSAAIRSVADIAAFHEERFRQGDVDVCLTCLGAVYRELQSRGIPARRITHTRSVMRDALNQAQLAARLAITESTQPAAVLIQVPGLRARGTDDGGSYETQRRRLRAREEILDLAERIQGRLTDLDDETFAIYTSRGTIEDALSRLTSGHGGPLDLRRLPPETRLGVGLGATVPAAEENARRAMVMGQRHGDLHVAFADGEVIRATADHPPASYRLRETDESSIRLGRQLGLGPLALARLTRALRQVDPSAVTASELARAYGIEARSARRLITTLQRHGIATPLGRQGGARAGRPQTVYRIELERFLPSEQK